jgi:beta-barrel assembly-enhancing protease
MLQRAKTYRGEALHSDWNEVSSECALHVHAASIRGELESETIQMPLEGLRIEAHGRKDREVFFTHPQLPNWTLYTRDTAILREAAFQRNFKVRNQIQEINRRADDWKRLKITVFFALGFLVLAVSAMGAGNWLLTYVVHRVPVRYEAEIGAKVAREVEEQLHVVTTAPTNAIKAQLATILGKHVASRYDLKVAVYESPLPNAFVAPGGYFYLSTGLLRLADKPEELAGVLAHEAAHLKRRHGLRVLISEQGHGFAFKWMFGGNRSLFSSITSAADLLVALSYSRELEHEADDHGWEMLLAANIDPRGTVSIFEKLDASERNLSKLFDVPEILKTHPPTRERIERLKKKWEKCPKKSGFEVLEKIEWNEPENPGARHFHLPKKTRAR